MVQVVNLGWNDGRGKCYGMADKTTTCKASIPYGHRVKFQGLHFRFLPLGLAWERSQRGPRCLGSCTHVGVLEVLGFWFQSSLALAFVAIWEVNQQIEDPSLFLSLSQTNKINFLKKAVNSDGNWLCRNRIIISIRIQPLHKRAKDRQLTQVRALDNTHKMWNLKSALGHVNTR